MDYFKKIFHGIKIRFHGSKKVNLTDQQKISSCLKPYERYLYQIQHIIRWEEPFESVLFIILVNTLFWFLTYIRWKFYGLLFALACAYEMLEAWTEHIWPEIRLPKKIKLEKNVEEIPPPGGFLTAAEIIQYIASFWDLFSKQYRRLTYLRRAHPPVYCAVVSLGCLIVAGIGSFLSGIALLYFFIMAFMILPGFIKHILSAEHKRKLFNTMHSLSSVLIPPEGSGSLEDYMPESTKENLVLLSQAGDNNELSTPSTEDSSLGDLMMPGYDESSVDTVESLLLPTIPQDSSEDTDSEAGALRFKSSHFNGDGSSTDEEVSLVKDLVFPDMDNVPESTLAFGSSLRQTVAGVLYKTFNRAVTHGSGVSRGGLFDVTSEFSEKPSASKNILDSDSEFEIIDSEDADTQ